MRRADLQAVVAIENESFRQPWTRGMLADELEAERGWRRVAVGPDGGVAGFALGRAYPEEWHLLDIAVSPGLRGRGIGSALLRAFVTEAGQAGRPVLLEVRTCNSAAIALYEREGFARLAVRRGYYHDTGEDALVMLRQAGEAESKTGAAGALRACCWRSSRRATTRRQRC